MRLFLKEQRPLIFIYLLQLSVISLVYWLDGYRNIAVILYAALLSGAVLLLYLTYRYITQRTLYRSLEQRTGPALDLFKEIHPGTPLSEAVYQLLKSQYRSYLASLNVQEEKIHHQVQFMNQWVHQMKTPLSVMHLMLQDEDDPRFHAFGDELDRLQKGLDLVLYTARLDAFEHDFVVEQLSLSGLIKTVVSTQKRLFIRGRVYPDIAVPDLLYVHSDEKWLTFTITQLMTNAVKYTVKAGGKVYFRGFLQEGHTVLEVTDEGVGIQESDLPRVFDAYFTGENGRSFQESTGMGLYLAKQICGKLGHRLELESKPDQGTTVRIIFEA
ncbi:sensor histidine kinase [Paenibacillus sp. GM2]|uniref:sensor histidine kinase n=1 Tax=Paenibacillus sp. GM2 TaxID=1622070 RepID=UPI0008383DC8|nr:sensor histidine kinase [Paenibacillus sp. GM2]